MEELLKDLREKGRAVIMTPTGIRVIHSETEIPPRYRDQSGGRFAPSNLGEEAIVNLLMLPSQTVEKSESETPPRFSHLATKERLFNIP